MDIVDQADRSAEASKESKMNNVMSAGTGLQPGKKSDTVTCRDPKWHTMSPGTVSSSGQMLVQRSHVQQKITTEGMCDADV